MTSGNRQSAVPHEHEWAECEPSTGEPFSRCRCGAYRMTAAETPDEAHQRWMEAGHCSAVSWTKAWCDREAGHLGDHSSPRVPTPGHPIGRDNPVRVSWSR